MHGQTHFTPPGPNGWELGGETGSLHLVQPLVTAQTPHREPSQLPTHPRPTGEKGLCGLGEQDLPSPTCGGDPGRPMHVDPRVVVADQRWRPGVDPHPHPHLGVCGPLTCGELPLGFDGCGHGGARLGKGEEQPVALGTEYHSIVTLGQTLSHLPVSGEETRVLGADALQEVRRLLDVEEEKRHRARGESGGLGYRHGPTIIRRQGRLFLRPMRRDRSGHAGLNYLSPSRARSSVTPMPADSPRSAKATASRARPEAPSIWPSEKAPEISRVDSVPTGTNPDISVPTATAHSPSAFRTGVRNSTPLATSNAIPATLSPLRPITSPETIERAIACRFALP